MRKLAIVLGVLALAAGAAALALGLYLDPLIKKAAETLGPKVAGVPVQLDSVSVSPLSGRLRLKGLVVGNPPGFKTRSALELGEVRVSLVLRSLPSDHIRVREVLVRGASATYELGPGGSNVAAIQRRAEAFAGPSRPPEKSAGRQRRVSIGDFRFEGGKARLSAALLGGKAVEVPIPDIHLRDVGGEKGAPPAQAAAQLLGAVTSQVGKAALQQGRELGKTAGQVGKAVSALRRLFK